MGATIAGIRHHRIEPDGWTSRCRTRCANTRDMCNAPPSDEIRRLSQSKPTQRVSMLHRRRLRADAGLSDDEPSDATSPATHGHLRGFNGSNHMRIHALTSRANSFKVFAQLARLMMVLLIINICHHAGHIPSRSVNTPYPSCQ